MAWKLNEVKADLRSYPPYLIMGQPKVGKALANNMPVQTPIGEIPICELEVGDSIFNTYGGTSEVVGVYPQGEKECYNVIFTDGSSVICSGDHLWSVRTEKMRTLGKGFDRVYSLNQILENGYKTKRESGRDIYKYEIPVAESVDYLERYLPIDPYLVGCLIADGYLGGNIVGVSSDDDEIIEKISDIIEQYNMEITKSKGNNYSYVIKKPEGSYTNPIKTELKRLGLTVKSIEKFIPDEYKYNSYNNRLRLLQGLVDCDGYITETGNCKYSTVSLRLAKDIVWLVQSLGGIARLSGYDRKDPMHKNREYNINIAIKDAPIVTLSRKESRYKYGENQNYIRRIKNIIPVGMRECTCITTSAKDDLFLTKDFIATHNTSLVRDLILYNYKDESHGLLISCGNEEGYHALDKLQVEVAKEWDSMEDEDTGLRGIVQIVDDLVENKSEYDIKLIAFDTLDKLVELATQEVFEIHRRLKGSYPKSLNDSLGGLKNHSSQYLAMSI